MRERVCVCCLWSESDFIYITLSRTCLKLDCAVRVDARVYTR